MPDEECVICGHLDSQHAGPGFQVEGCWPCDAPGCLCLDLLTPTGLETFRKFLSPTGMEKLYDA